MLIAAIATAPSTVVVEALGAVGDDEAFVALGRCAMSHAALAMTSPASEGGEAARIRARLADLAKERAVFEARLAALEDAPSAAADRDPAGSPVTDRSPSEAKIALFRSLFAGREDVFPRCWENARTGKAGYAPACANDWKPGLCCNPHVRGGACPNRAFLPVTDRELAAHLRGGHTIGVYPLLPDGTCRLLAADFDKATWPRDTSAFIAAQARSERRDLYRPWSGEMHNRLDSMSGSPGRPVLRQSLPRR